MSVSYQKFFSSSTVPLPGWWQQYILEVCSPRFPTGQSSGIEVGSQRVESWPLPRPSQLQDFGEVTYTPWTLFIHLINESDNAWESKISGGLNTRESMCRLKGSALHTGKDFTRWGKVPPDLLAAQDAVYHSMTGLGRRCFLESDRVGMPWKEQMFVIISHLIWMTCLVYIWSLFHSFIGSFVHSYTHWFNK